MSIRNAASASRPDLGYGAPVLAFDVGGTDIKFALIDQCGAVLGLGRSRTPVHPDEPAEAVVDRIATLRRELTAAFPEVIPVAAGLTAPGVVDEASGIGIFSSNLGWRDAPVRAHAERSLALPVAFIHDVRAAGAVEHRLGAARPFDDVAVIVIGTGVSATLIIDGRAHMAGGYAGEIGHACIDPKGDICRCGARGCLETVASAGAIVSRFNARSAHQVVGARDVLERAVDGDPVASEIWGEAIDALALGIAHLAATLAPQAVVIGGGLAQAGDALLVPLRARVNSLLSFHLRPQILRGEIGENAGLLGAALLARDLVANAPAPTTSAPR